ncbi:hypothetical protein K5X82_10760 [Halosquirtibacter xylanolyticus]|uniref:ArsC/Spx/MgsR family protein n=1 Tax=Halosquirtibacter xylanolyticus TaxID=3374599 RepID=UPI0037498C9D|nr:hypothetical protein K5X82_10760 [Prolixibacteraceae bacterium]
MKIYHNPRCKKSREGLAYLSSKCDDFEIVEYLKTGLTIELLRDLWSRYDGDIMDLVRTQEKFYKENLKGKVFSSEAWLEQMVQEPKLLQRPLVDNGTIVVLANPPQNIDLLF